MSLNQSAYNLVQRMIGDAARLQIDVQRTAGGTTIVDCGIRAAGGVEAGIQMAEMCLAGLGRVELTPAKPEISSGPTVAVTTDDPVAACMAAQYAGWKIEGPKFFAMGSGPMRAAGSREPLFDKIGRREKPEVAVGVLETRKFPPDEVCRQIAQSCGVPPNRLTLLVAPTASAAGTVQIVARSVETALHKLHELGFDLERIKSGHGTAPLPPVAKNDLAAIGCTNDAILYGGEVTLEVSGDDASLQQIGPKVPSSASPAHGEPFLEIYQRHGGDFYAIDLLLFSPAVVVFQNRDTGGVFRFGRTMPDVLRRSFEIASAAPPSLNPEP